MTLKTQTTLVPVYACCPATSTGYCFYITVWHHKPSPRENSSSWEKDKYIEAVSSVFCQGLQTWKPHLWVLWTALLQGRPRTSLKRDWIEMERRGMASRAHITIEHQILSAVHEQHRNSAHTNYLPEIDMVHGDI
ncbi:hypothetical protein PR048_003750 [Dryococelus australis]|uniref:Uncharacterized protein n=1 Tax=Dryococelus australis TaxID=614101 RepID=A0ABQ9IQ62_9NEOP|nr:hypothetical protein PR048_003750 [Dryococelus australis]